MDTQARLLRFVTAPFLFYVSLGWGAYVGGVIDWSEIQRADVKVILSLGSLLVASALPLGFVLGSFSLVVLRIGFALTFKVSHEAALTDSTWAKIFARVQVPIAERHKATKRRDALRIRANDLFAAATFDHELLSQGVHDWLGRRWTTFNTSVHSIMALLLAFTVGLVASLPPRALWWIPTAILIAVFLASACVAWLETMRMLTFQAMRFKARR